MQQILNMFHHKQIDTQSMKYEGSNHLGLLGWGQPGETGCLKPIVVGSNGTGMVLSQDQNLALNSSFRLVLLDSSDHILALTEDFFCLG